MEEKKYYDDRKKKQFLIFVCIVLSCLAVIFWLVFEVLLKNNDIYDPSQYVYVSIIRQNNNTDFNFFNLKRTVCFFAYFTYFPFGMPNIGYEVVSNITDSFTMNDMFKYVLNMSNINQLYTLDKISEYKKTTVYKLDNYDSTKIRDDFNNNNIVVAWDYNKIPELARTLGCRQCKGWSTNPKSDIMDDSLFDMTLVIRKKKYDNIMLNMGMTVEFYTIKQNFENVNFQGRDLREGMTPSEVVKHYYCSNMHSYEITKW